MLDGAKPTLLVEGGARGADGIAKGWADARGVKTHTFIANWKMYGKAAGAIRNRAMLKAYPGALVIAFPLPQSIGTYHCSKLAVLMGHKVMSVKQSGEWTVHEPRSV